MLWAIMWLPRPRAAQPGRGLLPLQPADSPRAQGANHLLEAAGVISPDTVRTSSHEGVAL